MQIKKLEVAGFKSFLEKHSFDFTAGITGIVGPNGCGKSNVVDAIKWVTGELSFKELRGRSMEDLIFGGSDLRPPTGMAEVALTLDNKDGQAGPAYAEYSEVTVVRRVFRDGTSEFFINKIPCRLRDIVDIFLDTGIVRGSYSIIEQGRIGMIVASKPEDRRFLIEEAAGITKYKHRKKAAQRKLEYTKQNLLRISDVLGELKRQIGSLERQARKAERYRVIRDEAREIDVSLSATSFRDLREQIAEQERAETGLLEHLSTEQTELTVREATLEKERLELTREEKELEEAQAVLFAKLSRIREMENRIETCSQDRERLLERATSERVRAEILAGERDEAERKITALRESATSLREESTEVEAALGVATEDEQSLQRDLATQENVLREVQEKSVTLVAREAELRNDLVSAQKRVGELEQQIGVRDRELESCLTERAALEESYKTRQQELGIAVQLRLGFEREQQDLRERLRTLRHDQAALEQELSELVQKLEGERSRVSALDEFQRTYQGYREGVRAIMERKSASDEKVEAVHGLLGEIIRAKRGYERAVEAVLAERIECLVVDTPRDALQAIDFLKREDMGRAVFLPQQFGHERRRAKIPEGPGIVGRLFDFIRIENGCRDAVEMLLHDVIIVEDLPRAMSLWEEGNEVTMVTLAGDLITRQGIIVGGTWGEQRGVLEVRREIEELKETIRSREERRIALTHRLTNLRRELISSEAEEVRIGEGYQRESQKTADQEKDFERLKEALRRSAQNRDVVEAELNRIREELRATQKTIEITSIESTEIATRRQETDASVRMFNEKVVSLRSSLATHAEKITHLKVQKTSIFERLEAQTREELALNEKHDTAERSRVDLEEQAARDVSEAESLETKKSELDKSKEEAIVAHQEQREQNEHLKSTHDTRAEEIRKEESAARDAREEVAQLSEDLSAKRLALSEERMKQQHLAEQIHEKYGLDLSSFSESSEFAPLSSDDQAVKLERHEVLREKMLKMGDVNLAAIEEVRELQERQTFLSTQKDDLEQSIESLMAAIRKINHTTRQRFMETFEAVNERFKEIFPRLFSGGKATLMLSDPENLLETGVEILAQPPGKRLQNMNLFSGGEKALIAIALIFAIFQHKAPPFCLLDEVDAPLDDANVHRFLALVKEMTATTQFIIVTHNKASMEIAENLYGITMEEPGVSRMVSVQISKAAASVEGQEATRSVA